MKRALYFFIIVAFLGSCSTSKKTTTVSTPIPIQPEGITFTQVENLRTFAAIQMPFEGKGFGKDKSFHINKTDTGEDVGIIKYKGSRVFVYDDKDVSKEFKIDGDLSDINVVLEGFKNRSFLRVWLKKDTVIEEYDDVVIGGKTCKRVFVSFKWDDSTNFYTLVYLIPHNQTMALFYIDQATTSNAMLEEDVKVLDNAYKYMIETVEFRGYNN